MEIGPIPTKRTGRGRLFCLPRFLYKTIYMTMKDLLIVYTIGVVVGIVLDNIFWYAMAKMKSDK